MKKELITPKTNEEKLKEYLEELDKIFSKLVAFYDDPEREKTIQPPEQLLHKLIGKIERLKELLRIP